MIQAILRHKSPSTTERYLKSLGLEKTRAALESLTMRGPAKIIQIKNRLRVASSGGLNLGILQTASATVSVFSECVSGLHNHLNSLASPRGFEPRLPA